MRTRIKTTYGDERINFLARDIVATLLPVTNTSIHRVTLVWAPPFRLSVPYTGGSQRLIPPDVVKCERAINLTTPATLVTPGGCSWDWVAANTARVDAVDGLVVGDKYELTFEVRGG